MKAILASLLCAVSLPAQVYFITVNDPKSHGTIGDSKLSLDEAVQLINTDDTARSGFLAQFSQAEKQQLAINPAGDDRVTIDAATVPLITLEKEVTLITTAPNQQQDAFFRGLGMPTIDAKTYSTAFPIRTNHAHVIGFHITGGATAVEADTSLHYHAGDYGEITGCVLDGQSQAGIRFPITIPGEAIPFTVNTTKIYGDPIGISVVASSQYPNADLVFENCYLQDNVIGVSISAAIVGGIVSVQIFRSSVINSDTCLKVLRPVTTSDGQVFLRTLYGEYFANHHVLDMQGTANGESVMHCHMAHFRGGPDVTDYAYRTYPKTARFDLHASEMIFEGNMSILASRDTPRIWHQNNHYSNGSFAIDNDGISGIPDFEWNVFESFPFSVGAASRTKFSMLQSEFVRSPIDCASLFGGTVTLDRCYRASSAITGGVSEVNPAGGRWLGRATVTPEKPVAGTYVDLQVDYQPGIVGAWVLGTSEARPKTTNYPFRYYFSVTNFFGIAGPYQLRDNVRISIPNSSALVGVEFFAQPIAVPVVLQLWQSPLTLPAGGRFVVQ